MPPRRRSAARAADAEPTKGERTRARVVAQAAAVFNQHGYAGTSLSDILRETRLEKGALYYHFESKDDLALAAFDHARGRVLARYSAAVSGAAGARARLRALVGAFRGMADDPPLPGGCPLLRTAVETCSARSPLRARARAAFVELRALVLDTLVDGLAAGEVRAGVDPEAQATVFVSAMEGAIMLAALYRDTAHIHRVADHLAAHADALCT